MKKKEIQLKKAKILKNLKKTYCRIMPSKTHGVGVFAIRDIPKNTDPFHGANSPRWIKFKTSELKGMDPEITKMIDDFWVIEKDQTVLIPENGLNGMDIDSFLNHSKKPNLQTNDNGINFMTKRKIEKGEELTADYGIYDHKYRKRGK